MRRVLWALALIAFRAGLCAAGEAAPEISLRFNGGSSAGETLQLEQNEPLLVEVRLRHPDRRAKGPLRLQPPSGGWSERVHLVVTDQAGKTAAWRFAVLGKPSPGALDLRPGAVTTLALRLEAPGRPALALGRYTILARLDLRDGTGFRGTAESSPASMEVVAAAVAPNVAALGGRQLVRVHDALARGDHAEAEAAAIEMVRVEPSRPEGFAGLALALEAKGERSLALLAAELALARAIGAGRTAGAEPRTQPTPQEIPLEYLDLVRRLEGSP